VDDDAEAPTPATCGVHIGCLEIVPGILQVPQGTSRPGSSHMRLGSMMLQSNTSMSSLQPAAERHMSPLLKAKLDEPVSFYPCM